MRKYIVIEHLSRRGEGLGNEILPWAKGFIASEVLDARLVGPSWGLNRRKYWRNFETSRFDFIPDLIVKSLPRFSFTEDDYYQTGATDFGVAIRIWAERKRLFEKNNWVVSVGGMYGGYNAIHAARFFVLSRLLNSRHANSNLYKTLSKMDRSKLFVAVHIRQGKDFVQVADPTDICGKFNVSLPMCWYERICASLQEALQGQVEFLFLTDQTNAEYESLVARYSGHRTCDLALTECTDLLLMAISDLRVCSVSSYSLAACYLSTGPYIWFEPQLSRTRGVYSLWGDEARQLDAGSPSSRSIQFVLTEEFKNRQAFDARGFPVGMDGRLPNHLVRLLERRLEQRDWRTDLIEYGSAPLERI